MSDLIKHRKIPQFTSGSGSQVGTAQLPAFSCPGQQEEKYLIGKEGQNKVRISEVTSEGKFKAQCKGEDTSGVWGDPGTAKQNLTGEKSLGNGNPSEIHCYMGRTEELEGIWGFIKADA